MATSPYLIETNRGTKMATSPYLIETNRGTKMATSPYLMVDFSWITERIKCVKAVRYYSGMNLRDSLALVQSGMGPGKAPVAVPPMSEDYVRQTWDSPRQPVEWDTKYSSTDEWVYDRQAKALDLFQQAGADVEEVTAQRVRREALFNRLDSIITDAMASGDTDLASALFEARREVTGD